MQLINESSAGGKIRWLCLTFLAFILALGVSWVIWVPFDFGYEFLYHWIGIDQHIVQYAPKNYFKAGFIGTTEAERFHLFSEVVRAIHQQGEGLATLTYSVQNEQRVETLFTHDEVVHLQDVSILIERMKWVLLLCAGLFLFLFAWLYKNRIAMPSYGTLLAYVLIALCVITAVIMLIGAHDVFYQLHVWAFPEDHKWFFYYEESLMSTMMKAPDLFGYIAILLVVVAIVVFILMMWVLKQVFMKRVQSDA